MIRRPPRSTLDRSSAASDVYKRQVAMAAITDFLLANPGAIDEVLLVCFDDKIASSYVDQFPDLKD